MREQLQELVDRWHERGIPSILWVLEELKRILATEPPAVSVKAGWVTKDYCGVFWWVNRPDWMAESPDKERHFWINGPYSGYKINVTFVINDLWPDKPNGGPECIMEVK